MFQKISLHLEFTTVYMGIINGYLSDKRISLSVCFCCFLKLRSRQNLWEHKGNDTTYACHISFMTWLQGMTSPQERHSTGGTCRRRSSSTLCWELGEALRFGGQFWNKKNGTTPNLIFPPKKVAKRSWHLQVGTDLMWITDGSLSEKETMPRAKCRVTGQGKTTCESKTFNSLQLHASEGRLVLRCYGGLVTEKHWKKLQHFWISTSANTLNCA